ncbi:DUF1707 domain-containing protein [Streptomyces sp. ISL-96]|uniref:DUF1707 SHOCT-like domain-containing protein n=1 Tax=Streptomyces sp. ISL-96 TaxID=2819191 RepID=UPI001BE72337|nr:DUF1707 domain-containing protein [Streptomyces sp. ISL-96]
MSSLPVGHAERAQAIERLKAAHADGLLDHAECEQRRRQAMQARTQDELRPLLADLTGHTTGIEPPAATRLASVRDRIADWLVRALRRAVFCWLPPPGGRRLRAGASLGRATVSGMAARPAADRGSQDHCPSGRRSFPRPRPSPGAC